VHALVQRGAAFVLSVKPVFDALQLADYDAERPFDVRHVPAPLIRWKPWSGQNKRSHGRRSVSSVVRLGGRTPAARRAAYLPQWYSWYRPRCWAMAMAVGRSFATR